jgi:hypothetical protein
MTPEQERQAFGSSLALEDGDLVFEQIAGARRLREVAGLENLIQALELRVLTPYGSDIFNVLYGLDYAQIFGSPEGRQRTQELIKLNLVRTLATDARIGEVRDIVFAEDEASRVRRRWQVEVQLETSSADEIALQLGIGG